MMFHCKVLDIEFQCPGLCLAIPLTMYSNLNGFVCKGFN